MSNLTDSQLAGLIFDAIERPTLDDIRAYLDADTGDSIDSPYGTRASDWAPVALWLSVLHWESAGEITSDTINGAAGLVVNGSDDVMLSLLDMHASCTREIESTTDDRQLAELRADLVRLDNVLDDMAGEIIERVRQAYDDESATHAARQLVEIIGAESLCEKVSEANELTPVEGARLRLDGAPMIDVVTCGTCGEQWNDAALSSLTPAPSGRCPFEYEHESDD